MASFVFYRFLGYLLPTECIKNNFYFSTEAFEISGFSLLWYATMISIVYLTTKL